MRDPNDPSHLYQLPPEQFIAGRDALAKRLRSSGDPAGAAEVKKLRKPQPTAWAINRVAASSPALIDAMREAGTALATAFSQPAGQGGGQARAAQQREREAVTAVVNAAAKMLEAAGEQITDQKRSRIATTLRASFVDPTVAAELRAGMLTREVEISGLGPELSTPGGSAAPGGAPTPPSSGAWGPLPHARPSTPGGSAAPGGSRVLPSAPEDEQRQREAARAQRARISQLEAETDRLARRADRLAAAAERAEQAAVEARNQAVAAEDEALAAAARVAEAKG